MGIDLGRYPGAAQTALRYVEDFAHRVKSTVVGAKIREDPVEYMIQTHRRIHRDGDAEVLRRAYVVAERWHQGQFRKSGEPYITHPLAVAQKVAELGMDTTTIVAALLHDTVEDTSYQMTQLRHEFGSEVALLVDGVTKFEKVFYGDVAEVETIRKMIVAAGVDVRVLVVKLADRLHNMLTIEARSTASRARIARATQDVLIPLCDRLGIQALKRELEDSVLAALEPEVHDILRDWVAKRPEWRGYVDEVVVAANHMLRRQKIKAKVVARPHHLYSIWKDTYGKGHHAPGELPRIAIVVRGETDCYTALGVIHNVWRPVLGRFKDFIASPKNNLYRALHTTVVGPGNETVEVQIRTETMERNAEYGIVAAYRFERRGRAAHHARHRSAPLWSVRTVQARLGGRPRPQPDPVELEERRSSKDDHLEWLRRLVEWQRVAIDPVRFLESLRCDLAEGQVHVFVAGNRLLLPANSTPVDVAYAIGPDFGHRCVAATVNGQLAFLSSPLADGDVVEIHTAAPDETKDPDGKPIGPSPEWLTFVRTPLAQLQIEHRLGTRTASDPESAPPVPVPARVKIGKAAIALELRRRGRALPNDLPLLDLAQKLGYNDLETFLVAVADHVQPAGVMAARLIEEVDDAGLEEDEGYLSLDELDHRANGRTGRPPASRSPAGDRRFDPDKSASAPAEASTSASAPAVRS